jgi:predicted cupin superfamily sugar epimerase
VNKKMTAEEVIAKLNLTPLPLEGGFFRQTYKGTQAIEFPALGMRSVSTAIFYLVTPESFSALHRVKSDEMFHFYAGDPVEMIQISPSGELTKHVVGSGFMEGQSPQVLVEIGVWQGLKLKEGGSWALMGTTVAPGFEYDDFDLGKRSRLVAQFPQHRESIIKLTRESDE